MQHPKLFLAAAQAWDRVARSAALALMAAIAPHTSDVRHPARRLEIDGQLRLALTW
jgi:hypothetical protein